MIGDGDSTAYEVENPDSGPEFITTEGGEEVKEESEETVEAAEESEVETQPEVETQQEVAESYNPDYSYKVLDQEKEFPELLRSIVKTKEEEDFVRDLLTRADGLDPLKEKNQRLSSDYDELKGNNDQIVDRLTELEYYKKNKLYGHLFDEIGIPRNDVIKEVAQWLREQDNPELAQQMQQVRQADIQAFQHQKNSDLLQQQNQQLMENQFQLQMDQALADPEVAQIKSRIDALKGPGYFMQKVDDVGLAHYNRKGFDMTAGDAVRQVASELRDFINLDVATDANDLATARKAQRAGKPKGHIPNVGKGSQASPVKRTPRSMQDLFKMRDEVISELSG